jgi:hypothetical protein
MDAPVALAPRAVAALLERCNGAECSEGSRGLEYLNSKCSLSGRD